MRREGVIQTKLNDKAYFKEGILEKPRFCHHGEENIINFAFK